LFTIGSFFGVMEVVKAPIVCHWYALRTEESSRVERMAKEEKRKKMKEAGQTTTFDGLLTGLDFYETTIQLIGAIAFNINTFSASGSFTLTPAQTTGLVNICDIFASCCFTVGGYLSIDEVTHSILPITSPSQLKSLDFYITWMNFLGGVGFLLNGVLLIYYPLLGQLPPAYALLIGSVFFQIGSHLQFMEQADKYETSGKDAGTSESSQERKSGQV